MGAYRSTPLTDKATETDSNPKYTVAASTMQGWRMTQEDAHVMKINDNEAFLGVFDGHGGKEVAIYAAKHILDVLGSNANFTSGNFGPGLVETFFKLDEDMLTASGTEELSRIKEEHRTADDMFDAQAGCTAVFAYLNQTTITVANAGDSRCVLSRNGQAVPMSFDHKPDDAPELARIKNAGGYVQDGRVQGNLNLSRCLGDFEYKKNFDIPPKDQMITADADIKTETLTPEDEFVILACDGVWDILSNQEAVDFVSQRIKTKDVKDIVEDIFDRCIAADVASSGGLGCDNMTCIILKFNK